MASWADALTKAIRRYVAKTGSSTFTRQAFIADEIGAILAEMRAQARFGRTSGGRRSDLGRVMERDKFRFGLFVMKSMPTRGMREEAASHPTIETEFGRFPALQIVTLAELMHGHKPRLPPLISPVKKAARVETRVSHKPGAQGSLL